MRILVDVASIDGLGLELADRGLACKIAGGHHPGDSPPPVEISGPSLEVHLWLADNGYGFGDYRILED